MTSYEGLGSVTTILDIRPKSVILPSFPLNDQRIIHFFGGAYRIEKLTEIAKKIYRVSWEFFDIQSLYEFLDFVDNVKIAFKRFWFPTWIHEFDLKEPIYADSSTIKTYDTNFRYVATSARIFILTKNGDMYIRKVQSVDYGTDHEIINTTTTFPSTIYPSDVAVCGRAILARFAEPSISFTIQNGMFRTETSLEELVTEYSEVG